MFTLKVVRFTALNVECVMDVHVESGPQTLSLQAASPRLQRRRHLSSMPTLALGLLLVHALNAAAAATSGSAPHDGQPFWVYRLFARFLLAQDVLLAVKRLL